MFMATIFYLDISDYTIRQIQKLQIQLGNADIHTEIEFPILKNDSIQLVCKTDR